MILKIAGPLHKEAISPNGAAIALNAMGGASIGAGLGGIYGAFSGKEGERLMGVRDGILGGALLGGSLGAAKGLEEARAFRHLQRRNNIQGKSVEALRNTLARSPFR